MPRFTLKPLPIVPNGHEKKLTACWYILYLWVCVCRHNNEDQDVGFSLATPPSSPCTQGLNK